MNGILNDRRRVFWLGLATFIWSMLFIWQGLDFTDMGYWLVSYQQFVSHPDTIVASCWLSCFIGHWTGVVLGGGVVAYKIGYAFVVTISAMMVYPLLASRLGHSRTLAALVLLTVCFMWVFPTNWVGYNDLSALFYLAGAALIYLGLVKHRWILILLSGVVLGANVFVRLPNLLGIALVSAIWLHAWTDRRPWRDVVVGSAVFLGGFSLGIAAIWGLIAWHGHEDLYFKGMQNVLDSGTNVNSSHRGSGLLKLLIRDHLMAFGMALPLVVLGCWFANWASKQKFLLASVAFLSGAVVLVGALYVLDFWRWIVPGFCYTVLIAVVLSEARRDCGLALLAFISGLVLFLVPLGSNNGILNSVFGLWLALPLALTWLWQSSTRSYPWKLSAGDAGFRLSGDFSISGSGFRGFAMTLVAALLVQSLAAAWRNTYLDSDNRLTMTRAMPHPLLIGTHTTPARAKVVTELLDAMSKYAKPGDEVLAYNGTPAVNFLTQTHPWLGIPCPEFRGVDQIEALLGRREQQGASFPCIVRATASTNSKSWPIPVKPLVRHGLHRVFEEFAQRHGYAVVWSNDYFEILIPNRKSESGSMRGIPTSPQPQ